LVDDFKIPATFFALALEQIGLLRTRNSVLSYIILRRDFINERARDISQYAKHLSSAFDYDKTLLYLVHQIQ
jgi:hypothetical protein